MREITTVIVHHSASSTSTRARQIESWHHARGWTGIGYHYVIEMDGKLVRGRPVEIQGAHALGHNEGSIGVCVVGWNGGAYPWEPQQIEALRALCGAMRALRPELVIVGHRDVAPGATLCPGLDVRGLLEES